MYIHIGGEYSVSDRYIVGIFDLDGTTIRPSETITFLNRQEAKGRVEYVSADIPRSFIVTLDRVFVSSISAATLRRRLEHSGEFGRLNWTMPMNGQDEAASWGKAN